MREGFARALVEAGAENPLLVCLDADLGNSTWVDRFGAAYPDRYFRVGIAEQNMVGIAAGMAAAGLVPVATTFAVFAACRAADQVRVSVAQPHLNVKLVGAYAGMLVSRAGCTHLSIEDVAFMRALPGMAVVAPADAREAYLLTRAMVEYVGPVYLRLVRDPLPEVVPADHPVEWGRAVTLCRGTDVALIATGSMTGRTVAAAGQLAAEGIRAEVLHVPFIKPLDTAAVLDAAARCGRVVTAEEHNVLSGFGAAVAELLSQRLPCPVYRVGVQDRFGESGPNAAILHKYGLTPDHIAAAARAICAEYPMWPQKGGRA